MNGMKRMSIQHAKFVAKSILMLSNEEQNLAIAQNPTLYRTAQRTLGNYIGRDGEVKRLYNQWRYNN